MSWAMTWKATVTLCVMCAAGLWGCGGGGGGSSGDGGSSDYYGSVPDGYTAISYTADAESGSAVSHDLVALPELGVQKSVGVFKDASATGTGSGTTLGGPTSIFDAVTVNCAFYFNSATSTEQIQVTNIQANCINENECIVCTATGNGSSACSLTCSGVVPSSSAVAADNFTVFVAFTSSIITDMPDPYGTVRHDASRTGTSFDLSSPSVDNTDCTYNAGVNYEFDLSPIAPGTWFTSTADNYRKGMTITTLDPDAGDSDRSHCISIRTFNASAALTGAATPGTAINNNLGSVIFKSKICDYKDATPVNQASSVCTEP